MLLLGAAHRAARALAPTSAATRLATATSGSRRLSASTTRLLRQRVGASDEERRLVLAERSEYGEEPFSDADAEEGVELLTGDAATVARALEVLEPFVSPERMATFRGVAARRTRHLAVAFERPSNPSNVWACLRTIDAFGVQDVHVVEDSLEAAAERAAARGIVAATPDGATARQRGRRKRMTSAMGAQKWLSLEPHDDAAALVARLKSEGRVVAATDLSAGSVPFGDVDWAAKPHALVFGNEEVGISEALRELADVRVHLPMRGLAESLNLSVSVGAALAHVDAGGALPPDLDKAAQNELLLRWALLSVRAGRELLRREGVVLEERQLRTRGPAILGYST